MSVYAIPNSDPRALARQTAFEICRKSKTFDPEKLERQAAKVIKHIALYHGINMYMDWPHAEWALPRQEKDAIALVQILNDRDPLPVSFATALVNRSLVSITYGAEAREEEQESFSYTLLRAMDVFGKPWMKDALCSAVNQPTLNDHVTSSWPSCVSFLVKDNPFRAGVSKDFAAALNAGLKHLTAG